MLKSPKILTGPLLCAPLLGQEVVHQRVAGVQHAVGHDYAYCYCLLLHGRRLQLSGEKNRQCDTPKFTRVQLYHNSMYRSRTFILARIDAFSATLFRVYYLQHVR